MRVSNKITPAQLKALHATFSHLGFDSDRRHELIYDFTGGRTDSSKELTSWEACQMLRAFNGQTDKAVKAKTDSLLSSIYHLSMLTINKGYSSHTPEDILMNKAKVNVFCRQRGAVKKNISRMNLAELERTKKQFEAMLSRTNQASKKQ